MNNLNINFTSKFPIIAAFSAVLVIGSLILFVSRGLNYGVDFRGGAEIQVNFTSEVLLEDLRSSLDSNGFNNSSVQRIGDEQSSEYLIKVAGDEENLNQVTDGIGLMLQSEFTSQAPEIVKTDIVGPKAGEHLRKSGFQAMAWALLMIMVYVGLRFDFKYAPGAITGLIHDVVIIVGVFVLLNKEFSLQIVGALLAVIGYSVNNTVVIYDRIREQEARHGSSLEMSELVNRGVNETLSRTILTSLTTLLVSFTMYLMGGGVIQDFFFAISIGVLAGAYSSMFVASNVVIIADKFLSKKQEQNA